jgi:high-affinity iron transporter
MISSFLLALREGVEAALIIGIVLSVLRKLDRRDLSSTVAWGSGLALLLS